MKWVHSQSVFVYLGFLVYFQLCVFINLSSAKHIRKRSHHKHGSEIIDNVAQGDGVIGHIRNRGLKFKDFHTKLETLMGEIGGIQERVKNMPSIKVADGSSITLGLNENIQPETQLGEVNGVTNGISQNSGAEGLNGREVGVTNDASDVKTENEIGTGVTRVAPGVTNEGPDLRNEDPGITNAAPGVTNAAPGITSDVPGVTNEPISVTIDAPIVTNMAPGLIKKSPDANEGPAVNGETASSNSEAQAMSEDTSEAPGPSKVPVVLVEVPVMIVGVPTVHEGPNVAPGLTDNVELNVKVDNDGTVQEEIVPKPMAVKRRFTQKTPVTTDVEEIEDDVDSIIDAYKRLEDSSSDSDVDEPQDNQFDDDSEEVEKMDCYHCVGIEDCDRPIDQQEILQKGGVSDLENPSKVFCVTLFGTSESEEGAVVARDGRLELISNVDDDFGCYLMEKEELEMCWCSQDLCNGDKVPCSWRVDEHSFGCIEAEEIDE